LNVILEATVLKRMNVAKIYRYFGSSNICLLMYYNRARKKKLS